MDTSSGVEEGDNDKEKQVASEENAEEKGKEGKGKASPAFCELIFSHFCASAC